MYYIIHIIIILFLLKGDNILTAISVAKDCDIVLPSQSIITVNTDNSNPPNLYYTLTTTKDRTKAIKDTSVVSNSISAVSLETLESQLHTTSISTVRERDPTGNGLTRPSGLLNNYRFAMTGRTWGVLKEYYPDLLPKICTRGRI